MHNNFFGEVVHPRCRLLYLGFSRAPDSRRPEYDSNSRKNRKEIVIYKCNLVCCSFDPTGMESEPGISGSMHWGKGTQVVGISYNRIVIFQYIQVLPNHGSARQILIEYYVSTNFTLAARDPVAIRIIISKQPSVDTCLAATCYDVVWRYLSRSFRLLSSSKIVLSVFFRHPRPQNNIIFLQEW